ncbi:hypothetical protein P171DRAFT_476788 [Karstenula rhodostoma CBS 690.94]|uniref:Uncharacterized protein n=1 Tax=Karstenula rhodostoma CBS 690.94 TaxID=1392251 RepID=A0A9P4PAR2_9PLEO|nr:hypothetical protein P171DRAFT_476788 [Karstenula rhodostoma CBS 690.94]
MFGAQWLILLCIAERATAYRPRGTGAAPYALTTDQPLYPNTTARASTSPLHPPASSTLSELNTPWLNPSDTPHPRTDVPSPASLAASTSSLTSEFPSQSLSTLSYPSLSAVNPTPSLLSALLFTSSYLVSAPSSTKLNSTQQSPSRQSPYAISTPQPGTHPTSKSPPYPTNGLSIASSGYRVSTPSGNLAPYPLHGSVSATIAKASGYPASIGIIRPSLLPNSTTRSSNQTLNTLCTVNVPSANIEWWYGATFYSAAGTYTAFAPNRTNYQGPFLTMVPNTQTGPFDVLSAIQSDSPWSEHVTYDSVYDFTWTDYIPYTVTPAAATTSVVERNYLPVLPSGNVFPVSDIYTYLTADSTAATVAIDSTSTMTSDTSFMYFTAYEVERKANGTTSTQTINLAQPTAVAYAIEGIENSASASGTVPADFLQQIPQSTCVPGTAQGSVTVLVVVDLLYIYLPHVNPFIIHIESTVLGWGDDDTLIVAAATSTGRPLTMGNKAAPTPNEASPGSMPAAGSGASESPRPGKIAPSESQSGGSQTGGSQSGGSQSGGSQSGGSQSGGSQSGGSQTGGSQPGGSQPEGSQSGGSQPGGSQTGGSQSGGSQSGGSQSGTEHSGSGSSSSNPATPPRETVGSIGTNPIIVGPSSVVIVGSQSIKPGAPGVTIGGSSISVAPSATAIVVNGHTSTLPIVANPGSPTQTIGTIGGSPVIVGPSSVVVGTQTLQPGGGVVIVNGSPVSLVPSGNALVVGSTAANGAIVGIQTTSLPHVIFPAESPQAHAGAAPPVLTIGSSTLTANAATQFFLAPGQTLTPGGTATVGGQLVSLDSSAGFVVVGGLTQVLPTTPPSFATSRPEIVVDGTTITALPNKNAASNQGNAALGPTFVVSGQTLVPGRAINVAGTIISLPLSGSFAVMNGATSTFVNAAPPFTVAGAAITPLPSSGPSFTIDGLLLTPGGTITVSGTTISLALGGTTLVVNGATTSLAQSATLLTIGANTYTALPSPGPAFVIAGQTLTPGGKITVAGTAISLAPSATALVVNGVTASLSPEGRANPKAVMTNPPLLTIGTHTYAALPGTGTAFAISGQTLTLGGSVVVDGTTISLSPGATQLVYGSSGKSTTEALFPATTTTRSASRTGADDTTWPASATQRIGQAAPTTSAPGHASRKGTGGVLLTLSLCLCVGVLLS